MKATLRFHDGFSLIKNIFFKISTNYNCDMQVFPFIGVKRTSHLVPWNLRELHLFFYVYVSLLSRLVVESVVLDYLLKIMYK